jgi:hypothetical protein
LYISKMSRRNVALQKIFFVPILTSIFASGRLFYWNLYIVELILTLNARWMLSNNQSRYKNV